MFPKNSSCQCNTKSQARTTLENRPQTVLKAGDDPEAASLIGKIIDKRYKILSHIGSGGMASVYTVLDVNNDRKFALKMIVAHLADESLLVRRLTNEAEAIAVLSHPGICKLHHVGETEDKIPYLVMDLIEGENLDDILRKQSSLPEEVALEMFIQATEALAHAHANKITHRDLKPSNILITSSNKPAMHGTALPSDRVAESGSISPHESGSAVPCTAASLDATLPGPLTGATGFKLSIVDFGIAKISDEQRVSATKLTQTGELIGSPLYMSPEQCRGDQLDGRSDIYSLGCVIYELLSGKTPFDGDAPVKIILKHLTDDPAPLSSVNKDLNSVVMRCLAKEPGNRYQSCENLLRDLYAVKNGSPIEPYKLSKRNTKNKLTTAAPAAATVLILLACIGFFNSTREAINHMPVIPNIDLRNSAWDALDLDGQEKFNQGAYTEAEKLFRKAVALDGSSEAQQKLSLEKLGLLYHVVGKTADEEQIDRELQSFEKDSVVSSESDADLVKLLKHSLESVSKKLALAKNKEERIEYSKHLAVDVNNKVRALLSKAVPDVDAALDLIDSTIPHITEILGADAELVARLKNQKANAIMIARESLTATRMLKPSSEAVLKMNKEALLLTQDALQTLTKQSNNQDHDLNAAYVRLATLSNESKNYDEASKYANRVVSNFSGTALHINVGSNADLYQRALIEIARSEYIQGNEEEAIKDYDKVLNIARKKQNAFDGESLAEGAIENVMLIFSKSNDSTKAENYLKTQLRRTDNTPLIRAAFDMALASVYFNEKTDLENQFPTLTSKAEQKQAESRKTYQLARAYLQDALRIRQHLEQSLLTEEVMESAKQLLRLDHLLIIADSMNKLKPECESLARQNLAILEKSANGQASRRLAYAYLDLAIALEINGKAEDSKKMENLFNKQLSMTQGYSLQDEAAKAAASGNDKNLTYARALLARSAFCCARNDMDNAKAFSQKAAALVLAFKPADLDEHHREIASEILTIAALFEPSDSPGQKEYRAASNRFLFNK